MATTLLLLALLPTADAPGLEAGMQYTFKGTVAELKSDRTPGQVQKAFDLVLVVADADDAGARIYWHVEENGRGRWPWPERFGRVTLSPEGRSSGTGPSLLYDRGDGLSVVPIAMPLLPRSKPWKRGDRWKVGKQQFEVLQTTKFEGKPAWQLHVSGAFGRRGTFWVDKESPVVRGIDQRVFMGMGTEYLLKLRLVGRNRLDGAELAATAHGFDAMIQLRAALNHPARSEDPKLTDKQIRLLKERLPKVAKAITTGSLTKVVTSAQRDLKLQNELAGTVDELIERMQGSPVPKFVAQDLRGKKLSSADLKTGVTVLHFWSYRNSPLKEPYGQVGYLDFLHSKRKAEGVRVYGVAVDARLREAATRGAAVRGVRKLRDFMNISYPVLLDETDVIKKFGNPQLLGAELPLYVVLAHGKIHHYKVGYYEVDRNQGLKALDAIVTEALKAKPSGDEK